MKDQSSFSDEQQTKARAIINKSSDAFLELSLNGIIVDCNEKAEKIFGWAHQEANGKNILDTIVPHRHKKLCLEYLKRVRTTGSSPALNTKIALTALNKNFQEFPVELEVFPIRSNGSTTLGTFIRNVSEKKKVELALRDSEEIFRRLVSDVKDYAIFMLSTEGNIVTWNKGAERITGYKADEIIGKHFSRFYIQEDLKTNKPARELQIAIRTGVYEETGIRVRKDGSQYWSNVTITALFDDAVHLKGFTKVTRDISEQKKIEDKLKTQEEIFRSLVSGVKDYAIFMLNPKGNIVTWNKGAEHITGYEANEIIGQHFSCFYIQEDKDSHKPARELQIATETGVYEETGIRVCKDGNQYWSNVTITALFDDAGQLKGFTKVTRDITEQKKANDELKMQAEILDSTHDAILVRDLDGTIRSWNAGAQRMYGYTAQEALGKVSHRLLNTRFPKPLAEIEEDLVKKQHWTGEILHHSRDGQRMIVYTRQSLKLDPKGKPIGILEINSDVTVHKQAEQRKLALDEMRRVHVDLEQFAYIASHDLQEPLRGVAGGLQILAKKYKGKLDSEADELISMAVESATRMRTLIADLLALSQITSAQSTFVLTSLSETLDHAQANLSLAIRETSTTISCDPMPTLVVEKARIIQLFQNLISNAIKFRSEKSCRIHFAAKKDTGFWVFSVQDNGIGFEQQFANRIFEPFKRLHGRDEYPGNGIGLTVCKRIIERHGGQIWAESEPNKGTTFYFTLPDIDSNA